jgi:maleylpyruvate isomerase
LHLKGLAYEVIPIHLVNQGGQQFSESYQKINPQNLVPSLDEGDHILTQSLAIIEYLDETHKEPALLPSHPFEKALVRSFALSIVADIHPLNNQRVLKYIKNELHLTEEQKLQWYQYWIAKGFTALEQRLHSHKLSAPFCFGNAPTLADICLVPQMYNARRFSCDLSAYPTLVRIDANCQKHPAFIKAFPVETTVA